MSIHEFKFNSEEYHIKVWNGELLGSNIAIDTETELVDKWTNTPNMITMQAYNGSDTVYYINRADTRLFLNKHWESNLVELPVILED